MIVSDFPLSVSVFNDIFYLTDAGHGLLYLLDHL